MRAAMVRAFSVHAAAAATAASAAPRVSLVQGSSRGLGLEFVHQLLQRPGHVIATCRAPDAAAGLHELRDRFGAARLQLVQLDTADEGSIARAAEEVAASHAHLDLLLNVSGVLHIPGVLSPETALSRVTMESLQAVFTTNAFGPTLVCKHFAPLLLNAAKVSGASDERPAVIANLSARVGSIGDNRLGGWYSYRASKAALNQLTKCMSIELARRGKVSCILLHPGTADTGLSQPFQRNVPPEKLFTRELAVAQLLGIVDRCTMAQTGGYFAWDGETIPW